MSIIMKNLILVVQKSLPSTVSIHSKELVTITDIHKCINAQI